MPLRRRFVQGFWFGLLTNGLVLYWMVIALWHFTWLSAFGYAATIVVLALFTALLFGLSGWMHHRTSLSLVVVFPVLWTTLEWIIGHLGDLRFPWLGLGTSLTAFPTLVQIADIVGARGVTLLLAVSNMALALAWHRRARRRQVVVLTGSVVLGLLLAYVYGVFRERSIRFRNVGEVALIQPNIGYEEKWEAAVQDSIVRSLASLSREAIEERRPDLVIWPEAAVPDYFFRRPSWDRLIGEQATNTGTPLLVGGHDVVFESEQEYEYFNSAFLFDSLGRRDAQPVYHKRYLVPIVERVPFLNPRWFNLRWFGGFGMGEPGPVYRVGIGTFGVLICYESAFEDLSRDYRQRGADFVVNITNDAWFGRTSAPSQHAAHLVMRAIENRVGIARAANTGISEFVDPLGRTYQETRLGERTYVVGDLVTTDVETLYTRLGDWVGWVVLMSAFTMGVWAYRRPVS
jgi:apolipoprotein N-acyltransferase